MSPTVRTFSSFKEQEAESYRYWQTLPIQERFYATWSLSHRNLSRNILPIVTKHAVRYLIVGGYAYSIYARPRFTADIDLLVSRYLDNPQRVFRALTEFGAPLHGTNADYFGSRTSYSRLALSPIAWTSSPE